MRSALTITFIITARFALAQAGSLDPTFSGDGIVTTALGIGADGAQAIAVQPDGKIVAAGYSFNGTDVDFALVRYNVDGSLDNTFSVDGKVTTVIGAGDDYCLAIALQPDGKILLAGWSAAVGGADFAVVRYNSDGTLDDSFSADGILTTAIGTAGDVGVDIALQPDGKILVAGSSFNGANYDFAVVRYNSDGTLDDTFSGDGKVILPVGSSDDHAAGIALQADGRIVLVGNTVSIDGDIALVRLMMDGTLDNSFGTGGMFIVSMGSMNEGATSVAIQPDQRIVVGCFASNGPDLDFAVLRSQNDGGLDISFSGDGITTTAIGAGDEIASAVMVQPDGRILLAGYSNNGNDDDLALVRYNADGTLDDTFGGGGKVTTAIGSFSSERTKAIALRSDGRIVVAGGTTMGAISKLAVARYISGLNIGIAEFDLDRSALLIYPDPLAEQAVFEYELACLGKLSCDLIDDKGRSVRTFFNASRSAGKHRDTLGLSGISAGNYTIVLSDGTGKVSVRVVKQ